MIPVALGALGVLVGLGLGDRRAGERRVLTAALLESGFTLLVVSAGIAPLASDRMGDGRRGPGGCWRWRQASAPRPR